jgi:hypothetical protein
MHAVSPGAWRTAGAHCTIWLGGTCIPHARLWHASRRWRPRARGPAQPTGPTRPDRPPTLRHAVATARTHRGPPHRPTASAGLTRCLLSMPPREPVRGWRSRGRGPQGDDRGASAGMVPSIIARHTWASANPTSRATAGAARPCRPPCWPPPTTTGWARESSLPPSAGSCDGAGGAAVPVEAVGDDGAAAADDDDDDCLPRDSERCRPCVASRRCHCTHPSSASPGSAPPPPARSRKLPPPMEPSRRACAAAPA